MVAQVVTVERVVLEEMAAVIKHFTSRSIRLSRTSQLSDSTLIFNATY